MTTETPYPYTTPLVFGDKSRSLPLYRPSFKSQHFRHWYWVGRTPNKMTDMSVHQHGNGVCLVSLAPFNALAIAARAGLRIKSINFHINQRDYANIELSGKRKRGAPVVDPHSPVAEVTLENDQVYRLYAAVSGALSMVNSEVVRNPNLLIDDPEKGWLLLVVSRSLASNASRWILPDAYEQLALARALAGPQQELPTISKSESSCSSGCESDIKDE